MNINLKKLFLLTIFITNSYTADSYFNRDWDILELSSTFSLVAPYGSNLTLKNLTLTGVQDERLVMEGPTSKLILNNANIILSNSYSFSQGSLQINNNSSIEGEYTFTFSGHNLFIDTASKLTIGNNITFVCTPTLGNTKAIQFEDATSTLALNNATFVNNNIGYFQDPTGLVFTKGNLEIDGTSILDNIGSDTNTALVLGTGPTESGDCKLKIKPTAKLIVKNAGLVYRNNGANSFNTSGQLGNIELQESGNFVIESSASPIASLQLDSTDGINIFGQRTLNLTNKSLNINAPSLTGFSGITGINSLSLLPSAVVDYGTDVISVNWSPDGKYLAIGGNNPTSGNEVQVYSFNGSSLSLITSLDYGTNARSVAWSPDGKYLAIGGFNPLSGNEVQVYSFNGSSLSLITSLNYGTYAYSVAWSPDGKYLAIGGDNGTTDVQVYSFNGSALTALPSAVLNFGTYTYSVAWSPDGKYLAIGGGNNPTDVQVYSFNGSSLSLITSLDYGNVAYSVAWSPDGKYLAIGADNGTTEVQVYSFNGSSLSLITSLNFGVYAYKINWSPDGKYLAIGADNGTTDVQVYSFNGSSLSLITSLDYGNYAYSVAWSPDGKYLAIGGSNGTTNVQVYSVNYATNSGELNIDGKINLKQDTFTMNNLVLKAN